MNDTIAFTSQIFDQRIGWICHSQKKGDHQTCNFFVREVTQPKDASRLSIRGKGIKSMSVDEFWKHQGNNVTNNLNSVLDRNKIFL